MYDLLKRKSRRKPVKEKYKKYPHKKQEQEKKQSTFNRNDPLGLIEDSKL